MENVKVVFLGENASFNEACEYCGKIDELRPYGRNGEKICFDCGQDNKAETDAAIRKFLDGE